MDPAQIKAAEVKAKARADDAKTKAEETKLKIEKLKMENQESKMFKGIGSLKWWSKITGLGLFITVVKNVLNGVTDVMVKSAFADFNPVSLIFLRAVLMISMVMPVSIIKDQGPFPPGQSLTDRCLLVFQTVVGAGKVGKSWIPNNNLNVQLMVTYFAIKQMPLGVSKMISGCRPIFTILSARFHS